ncbi:MAG: hypothetical protein AAF702_16805 [Chloroflexota bacterium]
MIEYIATLPILKDLYEKPRDLTRFRQYLAEMLGENEDGELDVVVPITSANPMGREHCLDAVNKLLAVDADGVAWRALEEAAGELEMNASSARATVILLDDVAGGWTNRYTTEANWRMRRDLQAERANRKRQYIQIVCWASEAYTVERIHEEARAALYRHLWIEQNGPPETLQQVMELDGGAYAFAGRQPTLPDDELDYTREVMQPHLDNVDFPIQFAFLFGDEAAQSIGYEPQGVSAYAGFEVALYLALFENERFGKT